MNKFPEPPPSPFTSIKCNLEPEWLSNMVEGILNEQQRIKRMNLLVIPFMLGPMLLLGSMRLPLTKLPLHIRLLRGLKGIFAGVRS